MVMKIGARLTATFGVVLVLLLVICGTVSVQMADMNANTEDIVNHQAKKLQNGNQLKEGTYLVSLLAYRSLEEPTPEAQQTDSDLNRVFREATADAERNTIRQRSSHADRKSGTRKPSRAEII